MLKRREFLKFSPRASAHSDGYWLHVSRPAMACRFEVTLPRQDTAGVIVANTALGIADVIERQLTVFKDSREVNYINRNAASSAIPVESSPWELLLICRELRRDTDGAFDITSGKSRCWGFLRRQGRIPGSNEIEEAMAVVGSDKLGLDPSGGCPGDPGYTGTVLTVSRQPSGETVKAVEECFPDRSTLLKKGVNEIKRRSKRDEENIYEEGV